MSSATRLIVVCPLMLLLAGAAVAQTSSARPAERAQSKSATLNAPVAPPPAEQTIRKDDLAEIRAQLGSINAGVAKLIEKSSKPDYMSAILGLIGVFVGGLVTCLTQSRLLTHQRKLADERAKLEISNSFVQWELKQLSELYGPLHALLRQSNALYRHMNNVLAMVAPDRFRLRQGAPGDDFDNMLFEIRTDNSDWIRFRTVTHISEVYGREYGVEDYFNEIVEIGGRIVKVITESAGYARPGQPELISVFGQYLAHYSVLQRLHAQMKERFAGSMAAAAGDTKQVSAAPRTMPVDQSAVFPGEIQRLVDAGFLAINDELDRWRSKAAA